MVIVIVIIAILIMVLLVIAVRVVLLVKGFGLKTVVLDAIACSEGATQEAPPRV